ncbi:purine catabolism regulatory family protein [Streptomyces sp. 1114.5]|uniref:PucR family transcriptional regulator n=1 Tax=unclassified Streptomyces TaxID=2593676 RepID=UPI000BC46C4A|nr:MULTISPECIES: PucR family transcriptional regulator [unclassified Streptomyces]RKT11752.1 purine catabolism regulatory family protein [Streptomyces sp. 1114.5]SOB80587.1 Purine catabolism regulatory protein-like family protein [Streptomyces sp. 1331.2]
MRVRDLLAPGAPRLRLLAAEEELDRQVSGVMTTDLQDPGRYLHGGELVLTGMLWRTVPADSERFVRTLAAGGAVALAAGEAEVGPVPEDLVEACRRHRMPLLAVPDDIAFGTVTEFIGRQVSADRAADLAALVDRHRLLVSAAGGGGLDAVLDLLGGDLDLDCWVLAPTGTVIAGPADRLSAADRDQLVRAHLAAQRQRRRPPHRARLAAGSYSLLPAAASAEHEMPLADWMLAIAGDITEWTTKRQQLAENLARLVAAERHRRDEGRRLRRRLADEVLALLRRDADPAEISRTLYASSAMAARYENAEAKSQAEEGSWLVLSAEGTGLPEGTVRAVLEEALGVGTDRALVAGTGTGAVVVLPAPDNPVPADALRDLLAPLEAGLGSEGRITLGVSAPASEAGGLRGALEEARHARRIAGSRVGRVCVAGPEELASHVLLLAAVPDEVRRAFRSRLLDKVIAYDIEHQADLVRTLEAFLRSDGSWTRCAAQLHVHVNTLRYRIGRIEELTGRDLSRLEDRVDFYLALELA